MNNAAKRVKKIFKQWEEQGIDIKISQNQYDVLVSLAFNMGISDLRQTKFIQLLKQKKYKEAREIIKKTNIEEKFPGLIKRRKQESNKFLNNVGNSLLLKYK